MLDRDSQQLMALLSRSRGQIIDLIYPADVGHIHYLGRHSEEDAVTLPEVILLQMVVDIVNPHRNVNRLVSELLLELHWVIHMALGLYHVGEVICALKTDASYDLFWNVVQRYAKEIVTVSGAEDSVENFSFHQMLVEHGYSVITKQTNSLDEDWDLS